MNDLIETKESQTPVKISDLKQFILFNSEKSKNILQQIKSLDKLDIAKEVLKLKQEELKNVALMTVEAEIKMNKIVDELIKESIESGNKIKLYNLITEHERRIYKNLTLYQDEVEKTINKLIEEKRLPNSNNIILKINQENKKAGIKRMYKQIMVNTSYSPRILRWIIKTLNEYKDKSKDTFESTNYYIAINALEKILNNIMQEKRNNEKES